MSSFSDARSAALVAEDHELYRVGLARVLQEHCGFRCVFQAATLDDALQHLGQNADISFSTFDLGMPGMHGASSLLGVRQVFPDVSLTVISASERRHDILAALEAGVHGYIPKSLDLAALTAAFKEILSGKIFLPWCLSKLQKPDVDDHVVQAEALSKAKLTQRQHDVLRLIGEKLSNKEIARELKITENTVKVHTAALYRAIGVHSRDDVSTLSSY